MIVLDGRTDLEKLPELLAAGEGTHLDYKRVLDLNVAKAKIDLIKDMVAMSNRPGGGYILIGVEDNGAVSAVGGTIKRAQFDSANLGQIARAYIEAEIHISAQAHDLESGMEVVVVYVEGRRDGLPAPFSKDGQYVGSDGRNKTAFRNGEVVVREGSGNVPLRHAHWSELLKKRDDRLREEAQRDANDLIHEVVKGLTLNNDAGAALPPLTLGMEPATFAEGVAAHLGADKPIQVRQIIDKAKHLGCSSASDLDTALRAVDQLAGVAATALNFEHADEAIKAIDALHTIYLMQNQQYLRQSGQTGLELLVQILIRVYAIGSLAVRSRDWAMVNYITDKRVDNDRTWLRHGQVAGSRAGYFPENDGGLLISLGRQFAVKNSTLRPDIPDESLTPSDSLDLGDALLNSLCQFDLGYVLITLAEEYGPGEGYPTCAAFQQSRANPLLEEVAQRESVRRALFPTASDPKIAEAIWEAMELAGKESWKYRSSWYELPPRTRQFVDEQRIAHP